MLVMLRYGIPPEAISHQCSLIKPLKEHIQKLSIPIQLLNPGNLNEYLLIANKIHHIILDDPIKRLPIVGITLPLAMLVHRQQVHAVLLDDGFEDAVAGVQLDQALGYGVQGLVYSHFVAGVRHAVFADY
jgi:hypothetical protein